jgi:branched-chain amino acid transport system permease protein
MRGQRAALTRRLGGAEIAAVAIFIVVFAIPLSTKSIMVYSVLNQVLIGVVATFSVWIMLRMNLLSFATPAFMAIGGYTVAIAGR